MLIPKTYSETIANIANALSSVVATIFSSDGDAASETLVYRTMQYKLLIFTKAAQKLYYAKNIIASRHRVQQLSL